MSRTLYVTDAGSVKLGSTLYMPKDEIPIEAFKGRESSLRELVASGKLSQRERRMQEDKLGRVVKVDRSSNMPPLPVELDDQKRPALQSQVVGAGQIASELAALKHERMEKARQEAAEAAKAAVAEVPVPSPKSEVSETEVEDLSQIADAAFSEVDEGAEDFGDQDEFFQEDAELLQELSEKEN